MISGRPVLTSEERGLPRVSGIPLLDGNDYELLQADLAHPNAPHVGDIALHQGVPQDRAAFDHLEQAAVRGRPHGRRSQDDRVVAKVNSLHLDDGRVALLAGVIACPFAKRSLDPGLARRDKTHHDDFAVRRDGQSRDLFLHYLDRLALHSAHEVVFAAGRQLHSPDPIDYRMMAERHGHRAGLAQRVVFLVMDPSMFARRNVQGSRILVVDHDAVGPHVHFTVVGIAGDDGVPGADISASVGLVPFGYRQFEQIDVLAGAHVFEYRTAAHHFKGKLVHARFPGA